MAQNSEDASETQLDRLDALAELGEKVASEQMRAKQKGDEALRLSHGWIRNLPPGRYLLFVPPADAGDDVTLVPW